VKKLIILLSTFLIISVSLYLFIFNALYPLKYKNEILIYEYSTIQNLIKELSKWLENGKIKEEEIYNIRRND